MDFKRIYTSSKTYIVVLIVAFALILFTASMVYKQVMGLQKSADTVTHTPQVYIAINHFSQHYNKVRSEEFRKKLLLKGNTITLNTYKDKGRALIDTLKILTGNSPSQQLRLKLIETSLDNLYGQLKGADSLTQDNSKTFTASQKRKIEAAINNLGDLEKNLLAEEKRLMQESKKDYASHRFLAPLTSLLLILFSLLACSIAFLRIYKNKQRIRESEGFLKSILATTDNIINYYEPIFDEKNTITDFKIVFANACNRDYLGLEPDEITGKTIKEVFPFFLENNEFEDLIECYKEKKKVTHNKKVTIKGETMWFKALSVPMAQGVLVTARNATQEERAKASHLEYKTRLEKQNLELLNNRAFLGNIFKSISHIVMHFKCIRNKKGAIVDFEILFVNDKINPVTGDIPETLKNKKVSTAFPNIFKSGVFENLVKAVEHNTPVHYEVPYYKNNFEQWFRATAIKLGDGVTVTTRDVTEEKKNSDELIKLNQELSIQNSILSDAESIAEIGSFIWDMEADTSEISDNFYSILGCEPNEFKSSLERFREFVHPSDVAEYDKHAQDIIANLRNKDITYRIITKQGKVKHLYSKGQFIKKNGKTVMIGVVQDVTKAIEHEENLLKSNLKLKQSNAELESFNRIASHDLQEPLRKVQLFMSRIQDLEGEQFSDRSKLYFEKVIAGVKRMQSLIINLLTFSRIDIGKTDFENVNLNNVLNKAKEDLATRINDAEANIISDSLPYIKGVQFQMEQLFVNLISNALKYRKLNNTLQLQIRHSKIKGDELKKYVSNPKAHYHKISFIDNGIGFNAKYSEKIFEVFQRLHQKTEYSGNGIGLAICKKIAENHSGFIIANGISGKEAEFVVYLPA